MNIFEAMKALEAGKKIRNELWDADLWIECIRDENGNVTIKRNKEYDHVIIDIGYKNYWSVYEDPEKTYTFSEMIEGIKNSKSALRKCCISEMNPIFYNINTPSVCEYGKDIKRTFSLEEIEATDWVLFDD